ncbi:hypothetical protein B7463_g1556, partial [Scytalidium lignicola]
MADLNIAAAAPVLHLDEVTGERVSRLCQKEAEKAAKLASRPAPAAADGPKKSNTENEEKNLNHNVCFPDLNTGRVAPDLEQQYF